MAKIFDTREAITLCDSIPNMRVANFVINRGYRYPGLASSSLKSQFSTSPHDETVRREITEATEVVTFKNLNNIKLNVITPETPLYTATERDLPSHWESLPWWSILWPGGYSLTEFLLKNRSIFEGRNIFDFACGCGVSSIAAAQVGAKRVVANDIDMYALCSTALNCNINDINVSSTDFVEKTHGVVDLLIDDIVGTDLLLFKDNSDPPDVIIAGDIFYDDTIAKAVLPWFKYMKCTHNTEIYFGDPDRWVLQKMSASERSELFAKVDTTIFDAEYSHEHNGISEAHVYKIK